MHGQQNIKISFLVPSCIRQGNRLYYRHVHISCCKLRTTGTLSNTYTDMRR